MAHSSPSLPHDLDGLFRLLEASRHDSYLGESVSQLDHATQCAALAEAAGADDELIAACLLHDIGHIADAASARMGDGRLGAVDHERMGKELLAQIGFSPRVCRLVELHVAAKRWLVTRVPAYRAGLSEASIGTLREQGGPMSEREALAFEADPDHQAAVLLRHCDEGAKRVDADVKGLAAWRPLLERLLAGEALRRAKGGPTR